MSIDLHVQTTLRKIIALLTPLGLRYHCTGGLVVSLYGEPRFTQDIDIVLSLNQSPMVLDQFIAAFANDFFIDEEFIRYCVKLGQMFQVVDKDTIIKVDFHIGEAVPGELGRSQIGKLADDISLPVVSKEDAILSKLLWISKGSHRSRQDVIMMLRNTLPINWDYLNQQAAVLAVQAL